jgi:uracil-DNA glycosylase
MKNKEFINYLIKHFGSKILNVINETEHGIIINSKKIKHYNETAITNQNDKCNDCIASKYRQDMPFWINNHTNKKIMVISQDAGKGNEDHKSINTVFDMHSFQIDEDEYVKKHSTHQNYIDLFRLITGKKEFLEDIYFTDIIKCAYSTDSKIKPYSCICNKNIIFEIEEVNPNTIILMGSQARDLFLSLYKEIGYKMENIIESSLKINKRNSIKFSHNKINKINIFFIPHFVGNLHISEDMNSDFLNYKQECCKYINSFII